MKNLYHNLKANSLTGWQTFWLTLILAIIIFGGLYLINPSIINN